MDINRLNKAHELLEKSTSVQTIIDTLKNLRDDFKINDDSIIEFRKSLYTIKEDLFMKLIEMKAEYDKDFDIL